jgi:ATP-dependent Lhr-like helicase
MYCKALGTDKLSYRFVIGLPGREKSVTAGEWLNSYILSIDVGETDAAVRILRRHLMVRGPFTLADITSRYGMREELVSKALGVLLGTSEIIKLKEPDNLVEAVYCNRKVFERIKSRTVALARSDIKPKSREAYTAFLFDYHGIGENVLSSEDKLVAVVKKLQGLFLPAGWWEDFIFPSRVPKYDARVLDYLCSTGAVTWVGRINKTAREIAFFLQEDFAETCFMVENNMVLDEFEECIMNSLKGKGACFLKDLAGYAGVTPAQLLQKIDRLVWNGMVTNDAFSLARYYLDNEKKNSPWIKYSTYPSMGRWSMVPERDAANPPVKLGHFINLLLDRYGLVSKEIVELEKGLFKWSDVYNYLKSNEFLTGIKRGFYVEGLSGIQFARDRELEAIRLKDGGTKEDCFTVLCSCDPANPYKELFNRLNNGRMPKNQGTAVVFKDGSPVLLVKEYGSCIEALSEDMAVIEKPWSVSLEASTTGNFGL